MGKLEKANQPSATPSFQDLILKLERYWADQACVILQPYDMEMGAATFHPATTLRALGPKPWRAAYVDTFARSFALDELGVPAGADRRTVAARELSPLAPRAAPCGGALDAARSLGVSRAHRVGRNEADAHRASAARAP